MTRQKIGHSPQRKAVLVLADGSQFSGYLFGSEQSAVGEVVFNTAMTGYQEILTDPSYAKQMVVLTCPHIGNVGVNPDDVESSACHVSALIVRDLSPICSNWRSTQTLDEYLKVQGVVGFSGVDTRALTHHLRTVGAMSGVIVAEEEVAAAAEQLNTFPGLDGMDLAKTVTCDEPYEWSRSTGLHIVVIDFGVKHNILRCLSSRGCQVTVVPAQSSADDVLAYQPDGVLLSNGPGDPAACEYAIDTAKQLIEKDVPLFGICLGYQILSLALGAQTIKMKFGHHGANHPVQCVGSKRVMITSQNHGFAVDEASLPAACQVTHRSLFDQTLQGFSHVQKPVMGFQGHPEASPGPEDIASLFDQFITAAGVVHAKA